MPELIHLWLPAGTARTEQYIARRQWLSNHGHPIHAAIARQLEAAIIEDDGYPAGAFHLRPLMSLIAASHEWQEVLDHLELGGRGDASLAANCIEHQMALISADVIIVYAVIPCRLSNLLVFLDINFPGRPQPLRPGERRMSKNILIFSDGTGNAGGLRVDALRNWRRS